jgi:CRP-like cAMP-binding protein
MTRRRASKSDTVPEQREMARDFVASSRLLAALDAPAAEALCAVMRRFVVKRGSDIFVQGDSVDDVFAIARGHVVLRQTGTERAVALGFHGPGEVCCLEDTVHGGRYKVGARAMSDVEVWKIPRATLLHVLTANYGAQRALINELAVVAIARRGFVACLTGTSVAERTNSLLDLLWMTQDQEALNFSQTDIAMLLGVSRQHVSQALRRMQTAGRLHVAYRSIALVDS